MTTLVCVLKTGGWSYKTIGGKPRRVEYGPQHVYRLQRHVERVAPDLPFLCLSDCTIPGINTLRLQHNWPGVWSKMELFRLPGPLLYMDLDVAVVGKLDKFLRTREFTVCGPMSENAGKYNTSVMAWHEAPAGVYHAFAASPKRWMSVDVLPWSDQDFLATQRKHLATWPKGWVMPYKQLEGDPPKGTSIVAFNGRPKPEEVSHPWLMP